MIAEMMLLKYVCACVLGCIKTLKISLLQVLNKIDLPGADPDCVIQEIEEVVCYVSVNYIFFCFIKWMAWIVEYLVC